MVAMQAQMKPIIAVTGKGRNDMARCKDCIHDKVCDEWAVTSGIPFVNSETCEHFAPTADVVPKSEVEKWQGRCREWYEVAELKSNCIMELDEGLAKANAEIKRLHGILLQFTDIVHKWGARNGIDTSEISLVPILQKEADGIVGKMEQEIETLKDNNKHLAVLLEEAKDEANRYKRYYFHHDYDKMIAEAKAEVARGIFEEIEKAYERSFWIDNDNIGHFQRFKLDQYLAELKKKYTEEKE